MTHKEKQLLVPQDLQIEKGHLMKPDTSQGKVLPEYSPISREEKSLWSTLFCFNLHNIWAPHSQEFINVLLYREYKVNNWTSI